MKNGQTLCSRICPGCMLIFLLFYTLNVLEMIKSVSLIQFWQLFFPPKYNLIIPELSRRFRWILFRWDLNRCVLYCICTVTTVQMKKDSPAVLGHPLWLSWLSASFLGSTGWTGSLSSASIAFPGGQRSNSELVKGWRKVPNKSLCFMGPEFPNNSLIQKVTWKLLIMEKAH